MTAWAFFVKGRETRSSFNKQWQNLKIGLLQLPRGAEHDGAEVVVATGRNSESVMVQWRAQTF